MIKSRNFNFIVIGSVILMGVLIIFFLPISASSQIPYFPKYNNGHSSAQSNNGNKIDNSTLIRLKKNTTANETNPDMGADKKSVSTKIVAAPPKIIDKFGIKEIYPTNVDENGILI